MELTISQYQRINKIAHSYHKPSDKSDAIIYDLEKRAEVVAIGLGKDLDKVRELPIDKLNKIYSELTKTPSGKVKNYIWIKGLPYKGGTSVELLKSGQYIDLKNFANEGLVENLHNIAAILYKPVFGKYDHAKVAEKMKDVKIGSVYTLLFFYSVVLEKLNPTIQMSLEIATMDIQKVMNEILNGSEDL